MIRTIDKMVSEGLCGDHKERGIVPRSLNAIFDALDRRQGGEDFSISMSFIEVYKEVGYDLLAKDFGNSKVTAEQVV
ncbi:Kinesin-related protein 13 [Symbiodinium microadriaticum]|uniref:Kinesin-related protein 13 n=1 Tax=Symbiodinium microadriaticum TaxID=2951 RepID=A0A1Q9C344_SYMMI|nr:Kinesin-related protein 13 [Symbiodinium microadriaticum]